MIDTPSFFKSLDSFGGQLDFPQGDLLKTNLQIKLILVIIFCYQKKKEKLSTNQSRTEIY